MESTSGKMAAGAEGKEKLFSSGNLLMMMLRRLLILFLSLSSRLAAQDFLRFYQDSANLQVATQLIRAVDGNFWMGGYKAADGENMRAWMYKLNPNGEIISQISFPGSQAQVWAGMAVLPDGVAAIIGLQEFTGETRYNLAIIRNDSLKSWQYLEGLDNAALHDSRPATGNRILISGFKGAEGIAGNDFFIARINADSAKTDWVWFEGFGPNDHVSTCRELEDGSTIFCGTVDEQGNYNPCLGKLDANGQQIWLQVISTPWNDGSQKFEVTENGDIWLVGESSTAAGSYFDTELFRFNSDGQLLWEQWLGSPGQDAAFVIEKKKLSRGFWVAGYSNAQAGGATGPISPFLMSLDSAGNSMGESFWPLSSPSPVYDMVTEGDSVFYFCGTSSNSAYLMCRKKPLISPVFVVSNQKEQEYQTSRKSSDFDWKEVLEVYDFYGRIYWQASNSQPYCFPLDIKHSGNYLIRLRNGVKTICVY